METTLDLDLQEEASYAAWKAVLAWEGQGAGSAALVLVDRATSEVLAWVGSVDYFDQRRAEAIRYARLPRSPCSALQPFLYALALERRTITPATVLDDLERGPGGITNADDLFLGPPRRARSVFSSLPTQRTIDGSPTLAAQSTRPRIGAGSKSTKGGYRWR